jgi:hypothetical protein
VYQWDVNPIQCPTIACIFSEYRFPCGFNESKILRISSLSPPVNSTSLEAKFSSKRCGLVVPGIGIMPCAITQAKATCVRVQPLRWARVLICSTIFLLS